MLCFSNCLGATEVIDKIKDAAILIEAATKYLENYTLSKACHAFTRQVSWRKGDLVLSLIRDDGTVIADASAPDTTWDNMSSNPHFKRWLDQAAFVTQGGESGWTMYAYKNDIRAVYVKKVKKDDMSLYLSVGFYPENSVFETELIVNAAADLLEQANSVTAFKAINDPLAFVSGDIVVAVIDLNGKVVAYSQPDKGVKAVAEFSKQIIEASKINDSGWVESTHNNATHRRYYQKVFDQKTQKYYLVTAGFYSNITRETVTKLVSTAVSIIKREDKQDVLRSLQNNAKSLVYGHSAVRIFNNKGHLLFDARSPKDRINKDEPSNLTQDILETIQEKKTGWKALIKKSSAYLLYFEYLEGFEEETYLVTAGFYPKDKDVTIQAIVDFGAFFMERNTPEKTFEQFTDSDTLFTLGDISLVVYTLDGVCLLNNDREELIWADLKSITDQEGRFIVPTLQLIAKRFGNGWANFTLSNATRRVYARRVYSSRLESNIADTQKKYTGYIIAAGYFT